MVKRKKQNLEELNQTHAKLEGQEYQTLDQILGDSGGDKYGTFDEEEYLSQLNAMNRSDLQTHAIKMSLIPIDNTQILRERLMIEFKKHNTSYIKVSTREAGNKNISKEVKNILSEGR